MTSMASKKIGMAVRIDRWPVRAKVKPLLGSGGLTESTYSRQGKAVPQ